MFIVNRLDTSRIAVIAKALGLTAMIVIAFVATVYAAPVVIGVILAALAAVVSFVAAVAVAITHAAIFAATMLLAVVVRVVIFAALALVVPVLWRSCRWLWAHRDGVAVLAKGLALGCLVVGVFVTACVWGPVLVAVIGKVIVAGAVMAGSVATVKII